MDNFDSSNPGNEDADKSSPSEGRDKSIPLDEDLDKAIPSDDDDTSDTSISHSPLDLGGSGTVKVPKVKATAKVVKPAAKKPVEKIVSTDRIRSVKTFFAKLHAGSLDFVDGQIVNWLKENPDITIKQTNTTVGNVVGKTTEPNIIITVWY